MAKRPDDDELEKVRRHVRILVDIGRIAGEKSDLNRFLDEFVVQVARAVEIDHVKVLQYRQKHGDLIVAAGIGWKHGVVRSATLSADLRSPPGRSFQTGEPVTIFDFGNQDDYILSDLLKEHGIVSLANTPVIMDGAAWGVLEVDSTTLRDFSQDTTEFLTAVSALIGSFVSHLAAEPNEVLRLAATAAEAQNRDVRLRELQHRVKNNFQLILASIAIQKRRYSGTDVRRALDTSRAGSPRYRWPTTNLHLDMMARSWRCPIICASFAFHSGSRLKGSRST